MFNPENIYNKVINGKISLDEGIEVLKLLIEDSKSAKVRGKCIEFSSKLITSKEHLFFDILENCLISDESPTVRSVAAKEIITHFPNKSVIPLRWIIQHDKSNIVIKSLLNFIRIKNKKNLNLLKRDLDDRFLNLYGVTGKEAEFFLDFEILHSSLAKEFGIDEFHKGLKNNISVSDDGHVIELKLKQYGLTRLPKTLANLKWLRKLDISTNKKLKIIPRSVIFLAKHNFCHKYINQGVNKNDAIILGILETLIGNKLVGFSLKNEDSYNYRIDKKGNVIELIISNSEDFFLYIVPKQIFLLKKLQKLNLSSNMIKNFPNAITKHDSLKSLDLSFNRIKELPESIENLRSLERLNLQKNKLQKIPKSIRNLISLKELILSENNIKRILKSISNLEKLEFLCLSENKINNIPETIGGLKNLKSLWIFDNNIEKIPESMGELESLEDLEIGKNLIREIPDSILRLKEKSLRHLTY